MRVAGWVGCHLRSEVWATGSCVCAGMGGGGTALQAGRSEP